MKADPNKVWHAIVAALAVALTEEATKAATVAWNAMDEDELEMWNNDFETYRSAMHVEDYLATAKDTLDETLRRIDRERTLELKTEFLGTRLP